MSSGKRKRDGTYPAGYIPQQDGASDSLSDELKVDLFVHPLPLFITLLKMPGCLFVERRLP